VGCNWVIAWETTGDPSAGSATAYAIVFTGIIPDTVYVFYHLYAATAEPSMDGKNIGSTFYTDIMGASAPFTRAQCIAIAPSIFETAYSIPPVDGTWIGVNGAKYEVQLSGSSIGGFKPTYPSNQFIRIA